MYMYINKLGSRSYDYVHPKSFHICVIHLVSEKCCFEAVLSKNGLGPLGVKLFGRKAKFLGNYFLKFFQCLQRNFAKVAKINKVLIFF